MRIKGLVILAAASAMCFSGIDVHAQGEGLSAFCKGRDTGDWPETSQDSPRRPRRHHQAGAAYEDEDKKASET